MALHDVSGTETSNDRIGLLEALFVAPYSSSMLWSVRVCRTPEREGCLVGVLNHTEPCGVREGIEPRYEQSGVVQIGIGMIWIGIYQYNTSFVRLQLEEFLEV